MTNQNDSFIDEVTEEVRRDKLYALFRRYGWIGVVAILAIVGGTAWTEWTKARARASAEAFGDRMIGALSSEEPAVRATALEEIPAESGQQTILGLITAAEAIAADDRDKAIAILDPIAADETLPVSYRHLALLKRVIVSGDLMVPAQRDTALAELATAGAPFRPLAMEQQALSLISDGKPDEAMKILEQLLVEPEATQGLRERARQLIVALGGEVKAG
jgi:hypothetical protein